MARWVQAMNDKSSNSKVRILPQEQYLRLRKIMHELSNVATGLLISAGLMAQSSPPSELRRYCEQISEAAERGAELVRESRRLLRQARESRA